jgi:hypothetical protein
MTADRWKEVCRSVKESTKKGGWLSSSLYSGSQEIVRVTNSAPPKADCPTTPSNPRTRAAFARRFDNGHYQYHADAGYASMTYGRGSVEVTQGPGTR